MGWEGGGWAGSYEVEGKDYVFTKNSQMTSMVPFSPPHVTQLSKHLNPWTNSSASRVVIHSQLSACQGKMGPFKVHLSTHGHQTDLRKRPE